MSWWINLYKSAVASVGFTIHKMVVSDWKNVEQSISARRFLTEDEVLMGKKHFQENYCDIFNFVDLYDCAGSVWSTITWTWVNTANAVILFDQCFFSPSLSVGKHLKQVFSSIRLTHNLKWVVVCYEAYRVGRNWGYCVWWSSLKIKLIEK